MSEYTKPVCRGSWALGSACKTCERCIATKPSSIPPMTQQRDDIVGRLQEIAGITDHARGCEGREYQCSCGYDDLVGWIVRRMDGKAFYREAVQQIINAQALALAQAHELSADVVEVRKVETVTGDFMQDEGEPFWRIEIGGYCADFDHEQAARNFAAAIAAMRPESEREGIVAWLRSTEGGMSITISPACHRLADAIERGDDLKEPRHAE